MIQRILIPLDTLAADHPALLAARRFAGARLHLLHVLPPPVPLPGPAGTGLAVPPLVGCCSLANHSGSGDCAGCWLVVATHGSLLSNNGCYSAVWHPGQPS